MSGAPEGPGQPPDDPGQASQASGRPPHARAEPGWAIGARDVSKAYGGVQALRSVTFSASAGEVHAIVGENGAGKSTLMRVLGGGARPDAGSVLLDGQDVRFGAPADALRAGIRTIHQELTLLPDLDVVDNVFLGEWLRRRGGLLDRQAMRAATRAIFERLDVEMALDVRVRDLSVPQQQLVEIAKALTSPARVMIMDEPSAVLAGRDLEQLFGVVRSLRAQGVTVLYISHRLPEVFAIADRATVLRNGEVVLGGARISELTPARLVTLMLGRSIEEAFPAKGTDPAPEIRLAVRGLSSVGLLHSVDLDVRRGEIVGVAGLVGAGRTSLLRAIFGADGRAAGTVSVDGEPVPAGDIGAAMRAGLALVPEDRKSQGLILPLTVRGNVALAALDLVSRRGTVDARAESALAGSVVFQLDVRASSLEQPVEELSGGNQQKVALGKWVARRPAVLLLDEPTRGVDVGAKAEIYRLLRSFADEGMAVVVASSELSELFGLTDRLVVMRDGRVVASGATSDLREAQVLAAAVSHEVVHHSTAATGEGMAPGAHARADVAAPPRRPATVSRTAEPPATVRGTLERLVATSRSGFPTADRAALAIWIALAVLCLVVGVLRPEFWETANLSNILRQASVLGLVAIGQSIVVLTGGIDLSVEGIVKLASLVGAGVMAGELGNVPVGLAAMVGVALLIGLVNGVVTTRFGASPFIVTLGTLLVLQGISLTYAPSSVGKVPSEIVRLYDASIGPVPLAGVVLVVAYVAGWIALRSTAWGRAIYAVGGSPRSSRLAGINVTRVQVSAYLLTALLCAGAALILLARSGVGNPLTGDGLGLTSITAVVLGGTSLYGGRGALLGTLGGVLLLTVTSTMLSLLRVPTYYQALVSGLVIVLAVAAPRQRR